MGRYIVYYAEYEKYPEEEDFQSMGISQAHTRFESSEDAKNWIYNNISQLELSKELGSCRIRIDRVSEVKVHVCKLKGLERVIHYNIVEFSPEFKSKKIRVITEQIAQIRMDANVGEGKFTVVKWTKASEEATIRCNRCGGETTFKHGSSIYTQRNQYGGFNGECYSCKRSEFAVENIENYEKQIERIYKKLEDGKDTLSEYEIDEYKYKIEEIRNKIRREEGFLGIEKE